jgi:hypothetical protein
LPRFALGEAPPAQGPKTPEMPTMLAEITLVAAAWVGIAAAAVFVATLAFTLVRRRLTAALILIALVGLAAWVAQIWSTHTRDGERHALESRLGMLQAAAWATGSPLACLEAADDADLATACEHALFASPQAVAAAASFTSAQVAWLRDARAFARADPSFEPIVRPLRAALEQDRFGFVAQALKDRYGCTAKACALLALFGEASTVRANLREDALAKRIATHKEAWQAGPTPERTPAVADAATPRNAAAPRYAPLPPNFTLPSADSIPPVSIMTPEPGPATTGSAPQPAARPAAPAAAGPTLAAPQAARPAPAAPPMQLGPASRP